MSDKSANREDVELEGWIEIYKKTGDKQELIYSSDMLSRMKEPQVVPEVSLQDAEWLEIRYYTKDDYYSLAEGYHSLEVLLIDFVLFSD